MHNCGPQVIDCPQMHKCSFGQTSFPCDYSKVKVTSKCGNLEKHVSLLKVAPSDTQFHHEITSYSVYINVKKNSPKIQTLYKTKGIEKIYKCSIQALFLTEFQDGQVLTRRSAQTYVHTSEWWQKLGLSAKLITITYRWSQWTCPCNVLEKNCTFNKPFMLTKKIQEIKIALSHWQSKKQVQIKIMPAATCREGITTCTRTACKHHTINIKL